MPTASTAGHVLAKDAKGMEPNKAIKSLIIKNTLTLSGMWLSILNFW